MDNATRFQNVEVLGNLEVKGKQVNSGLTETDYKVTSDNGTAAAGDNPTKAEFDKVVTLVNEIKADYNAFLKIMVTGSST